MSFMQHSISEKNLTQPHKYCPSTIPACIYNTSESLITTKEMED